MYNTDGIIMKAPITPVVLPSSALLSPKDAAEFYESACRREGLFIQSTFLKQLLLGSVIIQFENGYLGGNGVVPIIRTLQCAPLRALLLEKCALDTEDIKIVCAGLAHHPQLEKIDIRGVPLTIGGAKELLHLVVRNTRITEVLMDVSSPKYVAIQQQCNSNAQSTHRMSECVICGAGVSSTAATSCETLVTRLVLEHLNPAARSVSVAGLRVLCGALQQCLDRNCGILAVCASRCAESLAEDLCRCVSSVTKALLWQRPYDAPSLVFLRTFLTREHTRLQAEAEQEKRAKQKAPPPEIAGPSSPSLLVPGPVDAAEEERWSTKRIRTDIDAFFDDDNDLHLPRCTVCGRLAVCSQDGPTWLLRILQKDITQHGAVVTPVALARLGRLFGLYADLQPCSRRCVRHLVRYGLYGYGGVNCSYVSGYPSLSSALGGYAELNRLPLVNFSVVDIEREVVEDVRGGELNCALTVASALGDEEATPMDPYLLFSIGRHLRQQLVRTIGMDLASACEAARLVGCLPVSEAPFKYCGGEAKAKAPPRDLVADWAAWGSSSGEGAVKKWLHRAFAHRRQRVVVVDGPHRDLFDNIRAALWTLRRQARSVLVTVKLAVVWLSLPNGVIPPDTSVHTHGIYTTAKVIGQSSLDNTVYIILQCPFGIFVGHRGFLYLPKSVFLQTVRGLAFVFVDTVGLECRSAGRAASVYAYQLVGRHVGAALPDSLALLRRLFMCLMILGLEETQSASTVWEATVGSCDVEQMRRLFSREQLPAPLQILRDLLGARQAAVVSDPSGCRSEVGQRCQRHATTPRTYWEQVLLFSRYPSQLLFFFSELIGTRGSAEWLQEALRAASIVHSTAKDCGSRVEASVSWSRGNRGPSLSLAPPASIAERQWIMTLPAPPQVVANIDFTALSLPLDATPHSAAASQSPSPPQQRRRVRREQIVSMASKLTSAKSPQPPSAPPLRERKRKKLRRTFPAGSAPKQWLRPKSVESQASEEGMSTISALFTATSSVRRTSFPCEQTLALLQQEWAKERAQRQATFQAASPVGLFEFLRASHQPTSAVKEPRRDSDGASLTTSADDLMAHDVVDSSNATAEIPVRLVGKPWLVVPFPVGSSAPASSSSWASDALLLFIGDTVSAYSQSESRLLCGPVTMSDDPVLADFPFCTGVDAAVTHPTQPHLVFFFSGREWLLFDLYLAECVDGPYAISCHGQFRRLPAIFHDGLDGVVPIPHTQLLVFFRDYCYVVFDACTRRCVGGVGFLNPPLRELVGPDGRRVGAERASVMPPALEDLIRTLHPTAAAAKNAGAKEARRDRASVGSSVADDDAEQAMTSASVIGSATLPLLLTTELQALLGTAPMTAFCAHGADGDATVEDYYVVSRTGTVLPVRWQPLEDVAAAVGPCASGVGEHPEPQRRWLLNLDQQRSPTARAPLRNLPLVFRQYTTAALSSLIKLAVETDCTFKQLRFPSYVSFPALRVYCPEKQLQDYRLSELAKVNLPRGGTESSSTSIHASTDAPKSSGSDSDMPFASTTTTRITSSLMATKLGERVPQALSRLGSALDTDISVTENSAWHDEVFFYGDAEVPKRRRESGELESLGEERKVSLRPPQLGDSAVEAEVKSTQRVSFIEYDLGASAPQRVFTALLLILDTSVLPSSVLQLSPLVASVDRSTDGEVYFSLAIVRINGPVVAARWGTGPGSVTTSAARFWRLRFCTPVPASLGFVRLFWMEASPNSFPDTQSQAPTMLSPCTLVMLTVPPLPQKLTPGDGDVTTAPPSSWGGKAAPQDPLVIEAEELLQASTKLISRDNLCPVFVDDPSDSGAGWFAPHTVIPELGSSVGATCLFVCASSILQVSWVYEGTTLAATQTGAQPIARCMGFCGMPYPFVLGWDAAFYPAPREHPGRVALLRGDWMLLWDVHEQRPRSDVLPWRTSTLLGKLAVLPIATVIAAINCWSSEEEGTVIGVFHLASLLEGAEVKYVEFVLETGTVLDIPVPLAACLMDRFRAPPLPPGGTLHTVLCMPCSPSTWYMFWDRKVQRVSTTALDAVSDDDGEDGAAAANLLARSPLFYSVPLYLSEWGQTQHHCRILLDVPRLLTAVQSGADNGLLIAGIQLDSSGGRDGERTCWQVQFSENAAGEWKDVAMHHQASGSRVCSETIWAPSEAYALSKCPYWRLSRVASSQDPAADFAAASSPAVSETSVTQSYSQLRLLTVPRQRCRRLPTRVSGCVAATPVTDINSFFTSNEPGTVALSLQTADLATATVSSGSFDSVVYELIWDYGSVPVALCSVSFEPLDLSLVTTECTWTMWYGDTAVGTGARCAKATKLIGEGEACGICTLSWLPDGSYRYWRLQCEWRKVVSVDPSASPPPSLVISSFSAHKYDGPLITVYNARGDCLRATPLLWPMAVSVTASPYQMQCVVDSVIQLRHVPLGLTLWETEFFCEGGTCTARIAVEFTNDAKEWFIVAETMINIAKATGSKPQLCSLSWPSCGARVLWRLRVLESSSEVTLHLKRLRLGHCPTESHISSLPQSTASNSSSTSAVVAFTGTLHRSCSPTAMPEAPSSASVVSLAHPHRLVRVRAVLPDSGARYDVEYLGLDGTSWLFAAVLHGGCADTLPTTISSRRCGVVLASVSWDGALVSPSTHWRLRPVDGVSVDQPRHVEWFECSSEHMELIDTAEIPGMVVSTTGFTELQFPSALSGSTARSQATDASKMLRDPPMPVLQCTVEGLQSADIERESTETTVTWSFISPLMMNQLLLSVRTTVGGLLSTAAEETPSERTGASVSDGTATPPAPPPSPLVPENQPVQRVLVETSVNGNDYVAVAEAVLRLCDTTVSLRWAEVPAAAFWRLRVAPGGVLPAALPEEVPLPVQQPLIFTLEFFAARWLVRHGGPALLAEVTKPTPEYYSNTVLRSWISDTFDREDAFMQSCLRAFEEYKSTQSKLRKPNDISRQGKVAGAVQRLRNKYQNFLQKAAKEAGRSLQLEASDAVLTADTRRSSVAPPLAPQLVSANVSDWLSKAHLSSDLIHLLMVSATTTSIGGPHLWRLVELLHHPLAFRQALRFTKRMTGWFYPCLEAVGSLAEDWYGFPAASVHASLSVFWSLSTQLQRQLDALLTTADTFTPLNEHVASPLVIIHVTETNWEPIRHFPTAAPFLYAVGFREQPVTVVFAINDIVFTPPYAMGLPDARGSQPLLSPYPYTIAAGVNFVQQCPLARCPAAVMDVLRYILPSSAFAVDARESAAALTTLVLTVSSLSTGSAVDGEECSAVLRFTVSGAGVNFGLAGLTMESIEFEVVFIGSNAISAKSGAPKGLLSYQMNFISHGARFVGDPSALAELSQAGLEKSAPIPDIGLPLRLIGAVDNGGLPLVSLRGDFGHTCFTGVTELPGAVVTHLQFTTASHVEGSAPTAVASLPVDGGSNSNAAHWVCAPLEGEGQVLFCGVSGSYSCACTIDTKSGEGDSPVRLGDFHIAVARCSVKDLEAISRACRGEGRSNGRQLLFPTRAGLTAYDVGGLRVEIAATLRVWTGRTGENAFRVSLKGKAALSLENTMVPDATLEIDCEAGFISLTARCVHSLVIGTILVEGSATTPIYIQLVHTAAVSRSLREGVDQVSGPVPSMRLLVCGNARLFGVDHAARITLELSQSNELCSSVTLVAASARYPGLVVALQDCVVSEAWRFAQLNLNERALQGVIERDMGGVPMIAAMQAHQIPLVLSLTSIASEPYDIVAQRLSCRVKGHLYGAFFDVVASVVAPDDSDDLWSLLGAQCIPAIVEQCEANLWASYANVVGLREIGNGSLPDVNTEM